MFRAYFVFLRTSANAAAITTTNKTFVQNALLQSCININSKNSNPTPVAQSTAAITAIKTIIPATTLI